MFKFNLTLHNIQHPMVTDILLGAGNCSENKFIIIALKFIRNF